MTESLCQIPEGINGYKALAELSATDPREARALRLLERAMQENGVNDSQEAFETMGDLAIRMSYLSANGIVSIDTSKWEDRKMATLIHKCIDIFERWNDLLESELQS